MKTKNIEYDRNVDVFKDDFINKFMKTFPGFYAKEEMDLILKDNVRQMSYEPNLETCDGKYIIDQRKIEYKYELNNILFHEFVHGLIGDDYIYGFSENNAIAESFTAYAERIYVESEMTDFKENFDNIKFVYLSDRTIKTKQMATYETLSLLAQQLELLNIYSGNTEPLLKTYLKRENIYNRIKDIYMKAYEIEGSNLTERDAKLETIELVKKLSEVCKLIKQRGDIENIKEYILEFEKETERLHNILNVKGYSRNNYNNLSVVNYIYSPEEKIKLNKIKMLNILANL